MYEERVHSIHTLFRLGRAASAAPAVPISILARPCARLVWVTFGPCLPQPWVLPFLSAGVRVVTQE